MKKNLLLTLLFILASCAIATAKNDNPKIQGWVERGEYKESTFKDDSLIFMKYSADGKKLFTANTGGHFREFDVASGEMTREIKTNISSCEAFDYDEIGDNLVISSGKLNKRGYILTCFNKGILKYQNSQILVSDGYCVVTERSVKNIIDVNSGSIYSLCYSNYDVGPGGGTEGKIVIHNLSDGLIKKEINIGYCSKMEISPDKNYLVINSRNFRFSYLNGLINDYYDLFVYNINNNSNVKVNLDNRNPEYLKSISNDSKYLITQNFDSTIVFRNISDLSIAYKYSSLLATSLKHSLNDKVLISLNNATNNLFSLYKYKSDILLKQVKRNPDSYEGKLMELSPDSSSIAILGTDGRIRIYNPDMLNPDRKSWFVTKDSVAHVGSECKFYDESSNSPIAWTWDFGDGTTSNEQNPVHTYSNVGTYSIRLISDYGSKKDTALFKDMIKVIPTINPKLTASITSGVIPFDVDFKFSCDIPLDHVDWDFGDFTYLTNSNDLSTTKTYSRLGKFLPKIKIFDGYHYHEYAYSDSIETRYPEPAMFDIAFEKEYFDNAGKNGISCGFVAKNGDLIFGINQRNSYKTDYQYNKDGSTTKSYFRAYINRYDSNGDISISTYTSHLHNFVELPNGNYFLVGSYWEYYKGYYYEKSENIISPNSYDKTNNIYNSIPLSLQYGWELRYPVTQEKVNLICTADSRVFFQVFGSERVYFQNSGSAPVQDYNIPGLIAIALVNNENLLACIQKPKDSLKLITFNSDWTKKDSVVTKIDTGAHINKMLYSDKYGYFLVGSLKTGTKTDGVVYLYDKLGNQKMRYVKNDTANTEFNTILYMGGANFAVAGNSGRTMGIEFVQADSLSVKFVELTGRTGVINAIDKTADGKLFIVGTSIIYGKPKGIVQPGNSGGKNPSEKILMLENTPDEYKGYAALLGVSKILGVAEELPRQSGSQLNLLVSQSADIATISYSLSHSSRVSLKLYDMLGRLVATIFEGEETDGICRHEFRTTGILPGIYLLRLESADGQSVAKIAVGR